MFSDSDRGGMLNLLLAEVDFANLPTWDDSQVATLRNEIRESLRKPNGMAKVCRAFESSCKFDHTSGAFMGVEDIVLGFIRWAGCSKADGVSLSFALTFSANKLLSFAARKALRAKLPEVVSPMILAEMPDEVKTGLVHAIQSDEELAANEVSGNYIAAYRDTYGISALMSPTLGAIKPSLNSADLSALSKLGDLTRQRVSLVSFFEECGSQCSLTADHFRKTLLGSGIRIDEEQLAGLIVLVMPKSYNPPDTSLWNLEAVAEVLNQECRSLNWTAVAKYLDTPRLSIRTEGDYQILSRLFVRISGAPIQAAGLLASLWNNRPAQFAMLMLSANAPRAIVDFAPLISQEQVLTGEGIAVPPNLSWLCIPLYVRLLDLASSGLAMEVLEVIAKAATMYPEYVLTSLAQVQDHSGVRNELLQRLLPLFTGLPNSRASSLPVMKKLYSTNVDLLLRLFCVAFRRAKKVGEVITVENIVKSLGSPFIRKLEEEGSAEELASLWCIKADKGELNLEEKMAAVIEQNPKNARGLVNFIRVNAETMRPRFSQLSDSLLSFESCVVLIRALHTVLPQEETKALVAIFQQQQNLMNHQQQQQMLSSQVMPSPSQNIPPQYNREVRDVVDSVEVMRLAPGQETQDVEAIANAYFQKIYTTDISIPDVVGLMRNFKSSSEKKEQEIFRCMVHNLFDEYRFFHKYPEKELQITGRLFGALIQHQLVSSITLGIALRYVLEALRKDPEQGEGNEKMFRFGQVALDQFRSRLGEWPQYCSHLIQIPHLSRHNAELFQEAQRALSNPMPQQVTAMTPGPATVHQPGSASSQYSTPSYDYDGSSGGGGGGGYSAFLSHQAPPPSFPPIPQSTSSSMLSSTPLSVGSLGGSIGPASQQYTGLAFGAASAESSSVLGTTMSKATISPPPSFSTPSSAFLSSPPVPAVELSNASIAAALAATPALPVAAVAMAAREAEVVEDDDSERMEINRMQLVNKMPADPAVPPDSIRDQVQFVINNVAKNNLEAKGNELKELLKPEFFAWFANYLVEKRVSSQPNLHPLYLSMLDNFQLFDLNKHILDSTYYNVTKYLSSPIITSSSNERSVLRNFGMWLGQLTLARNRPLLLKRINMKELIFWGYETGRLIAVCSFIAKVIEGAKESKVFRPPNPWLMAILGLLKELNEVEDLKLNIKFEVQALCKNINVKIDEIPKTNLLPKCRPPVKDQRNPDFNIKPGNQGTTAVQPSPVQAAQTVPSQQPPTTAALPPPVDSASVTTAVAGVAVDVSASVVINASLQFFAANPNHRRSVVVAVERGIREIINAAVDRAVSIATATTKQLIVKDFANEGNEVVVRNAAHLMVSSLASSLALAICKEPLRISIGNHLRTLLTPAVTDQSVMEQIVQVCSNDNIDLGSVLIEKASIEKATKDVDEALLPAFLARRKAREAGQPFLDTAAVPQLPSKLSVELQDLLRLNPTGLSVTQLQLYEAFQRVKAPAATASPQSATLAAPPMESKPTVVLPAAAQGPALSMSQALEAYQVLYTRIDTALKSVQAQAQGREVTVSMLGADHEVVLALRELLAVTQRTQAAVRNETAMTFSETLFHKMFDSISNPDPLRLEVSVAILEAVRDACGGAKVFNPDIMSWLGKYALLVSNDDISRKVYRHILILLLRAKLVRAQDIDRYLTMHMDGGRHLFWLEVALSFIKQCFMENLCNVYDFTNTLDTITKMRPSSMIMKKQLQKWITDIRALATAQEEQRLTPGATANTTTAGTSSTAVAASPAVSRADTALKEQVIVLLDRWLRVWNNVNDQIFAHYLQLMHQVGVLKTEDAADRFFRVATDICVDACLKSANATGADASGTLTYTVIDALVRLFLLLIRLADKETSDINVRVNLLNRILNAILRAFLEDLEQRKLAGQPFDPRPFYRLFSGLSQDLGIPDPKTESNAAQLPLLNAYTQAFLAVQPTIAPAFAFCWLQLISKRWFMPHLLRSQKCWPAMHRLLSALFGFMQPFLKLGQLPDAVKKLYKGTLRVLLILLHDFPEFLCDFHLSFCDIIPVNCVQLRNLILSAFPRTMRLPDPFTPNLKVDILSEINHSPRILTDYAVPIAGIRSHLDSYMNSQQPADLPAKLAVVLMPTASAGYNAPLLTSLVVYLGSVWIAQIQSKMQIPVASPAMDIFKALIKGLDSEGRYILINAMANQLRYPNSHTSLFSNVLLNLFAEAEDEFVQEQITRVLLERLIVHRPHPWGLLITFIELIKNPRFSFWKKAFTRGDSEVEKVFENIARSCIGPSATTVIQQQLGQPQPLV